MKKIAFLVDSSFVIPLDEINNPITKKIHFVPLIVIDPDLNEYKDEKTTLNSKELIQLLNTYPEQTLKTSITPQAIVEEKLKTLLKSYDYVVLIPIAKLLSNQYELFQNLIKNNLFKNRAIIAGIENKPFTSFEFINQLMTNLIKNNCQSFECLKKEINNLENKFKSFAVVVVESLNRLYLSGRVSKTKVKVTKAFGLKISLILTKDGLVKLETARSIFKLMKDSIIKGCKRNKINIKEATIYFMPFCLSEEAITKLLEIGRELGCNIVYDVNQEVPSIIAAHIGLRHFLITVCINK